MGPACALPGWVLRARQDRLEVLLALQRPRQVHEHRLHNAVRCRVLVPGGPGPCPCWRAWAWGGGVPGGVGVGAGWLFPLPWGGQPQPCVRGTASFLRVLGSFSTAHLSLNT